MYSVKVEYKFIVIYVTKIIKSQGHIKKSVVFLYLTL